MAIDPIASAHKWESFYSGEDGIKVVLDSISESYIRRMASTDFLDPGFQDRLAVLAIAARVVREIDSSFRQIIDGGKLAEAAADNVSRIESLSPAVRRYI